MVLTELSFFVIFLATQWGHLEYPLSRQINTLKPPSLSQLCITQLTFALLMLVVRKKEGTLKWSNNAFKENPISEDGTYIIVGFDLGIREKYRRLNIAIGFFIQDAPSIPMQIWGNLLRGFSLFYSIFIFLFYF